MDRKGYSAGADTGAQPPLPTTSPSGRQAKEWGDVHWTEGTPLPLPLSMSSSQSLADRWHRFCHLIITKGKRESGRTMTGSVCEGDGLMDGSVISIHTRRAEKWSAWVGDCTCMRTLTYHYTHTRAHLWTHTPIKCTNIFWLKSSCVSHEL